jgi:hypothetical protein
MRRTYFEVWTRCQARREMVVGTVSLRQALAVRCSGAQEPLCP